MPAIEFVGESARDSDNIAGAPSRLLNCYREPTAEGRHVLKPVKGLSDYVDLGGVFVRAMATVDGKLFVVSGGRLYQIHSRATVFDRGPMATGQTTNSSSATSSRRAVITTCSSLGTTRTTPRTS